MASFISRWVLFDAYVAKIYISQSRNTDTKYVSEYSDELARRYIEKVIIKDKENIRVLFKGGFIVDQRL